MTGSQRDHSQASIPEIKKIPLIGRNIEIKKLRLGGKIKVSRIFAKLAKALKGDNWVQLTNGKAVPRSLDLDNLDILDVVESLPTFLHEVEVQYPEFVSLTTDIKDDEIQDLDIPDLFVIADECWKHNGFAKSVEDALGKVLREDPAQEPEASQETEKDQGPSKT